MQAVIAKAGFHNILDFAQTHKDTEEQVVCLERGQLTLKSSVSSGVREVQDVVSRLKGYINRANIHSANILPGRRVVPFGELSSSYMPTVRQLLLLKDADNEINPKVKQVLEAESAILNRVVSNVSNDRAAVLTLKLLAPQLGALEQAAGTNYNNTGLVQSLEAIKRAAHSQPKKKMIEQLVGKLKEGDAGAEEAACCPPYAEDPTKTKTTVEYFDTPISTGGGHRGRRLTPKVARETFDSDISNCRDLKAERKRKKREAELQRRK